MVREGLPEGLTFGVRPGGFIGVYQAKSKGDGMCKGPEEGMSLSCWSENQDHRGWSVVREGRRGQRCSERGGEALEHTRPCRRCLEAIQEQREGSFCAV